MEFEVVDNQDKKRFEAEVDGHMAYVEYIRAKSAVYLTHTEVHPSMEGKGIGSQLVAKVLHILDAEGDALAPLCPFVAAYVKRHPEWKKLLAPGYHV